MKNREAIVKPSFLATGIGSMPFTDARYAAELSLKRFGEAPYWPQLPRLGLCEQMNVQYTEGMPGIVIDKERNKIYFDTRQDTSEVFAEFYEKYFSAMEGGGGDFSAMGVSEEYSRGIYAFEEALRGSPPRGRGGKPAFVKVQTTGPCSFTLGVTDEKEQSIFYNREFREMAVKALAMKCRWQIRKFAAYAERVICFVDEPVLSAYGSSTYIAVSREDMVAMLAEVIEAIHADGAIAGVHCCGNTEWSILVDAGADIVNFDAFEFGETIGLYPEAVKEHFGRGGMLAWGIVPTSEAIREQSTESLAELLERMMDNLASKGIDKGLIAERALITPSCGAGSMEAADAERVFELTSELSKVMRKKYGE